MIKEITEINISNDDYLLKELRKNNLKRYISRRIDEIENSFIKLCEEFEDRFSKNEWILMTDNIYYINEIMSFIPNLDDNEVYWHSQDSFSEFSINSLNLEFRSRIGVIPTEKEIISIFLTDNIFKLQNGKIRCCGKDYDGLTFAENNFVIFNSEFEPNIFKYGSKEIEEKNILTIPVSHLNGIDSSISSVSDIILKWLEDELRPNEFRSDETRKIYAELRYIYSKKKYRDFLKSDSNSIIFNDKEILVNTIYSDCLQTSKFNFLREVNNILNENKELEADDDFLNELENRFLECDNKRAILDKYPKHLLYGINLGHWDLFDYNDSIIDGVKVKLNTPMYAKNPEDDIVDNCVVAIDFGTKSTVVSYKDSKPPRKVIPINVGKINNAPDITDYENPSIMYFIDFLSFFKNYNLKIGRPYTDWENLTISHSALNDLKNADERSFESFLTDLKSWCSSNKINRVKDRDNKKLIEFKPFLEIGENDPNPIEYYAYFLGLYINNMHRGNIFIKYKMSFPVTYKIELREKILESFSRGIKKSFPTSLLSNENVMKKFKVEFGVSEPAAYASTALEKYNFKPQENEKFYYSVFDFGGGTTDFDFGVYCGVNQEEKDSYNYRLIHFGESGDSTLGGEKLLKYLAFEIFKINIKNLILGDGTKIQFTIDDIRTDSDCLGFEHLINNDSTYAKRNMYNLMEKLRWAWEGEKADDYNTVDDYKQGVIYLDLIDENGDVKKNFCLSSYKNNDDGSQVFVDLQELLHKRIDKTVKCFFESMREGFKYASNDRKFDLKDLNDIDEISIFLAGNSTKSVLFREILNSYIIDEVVQTLSQDYSMSEYSDREVVIPIYSSSANCKAKKILGLNSDSHLKFNIYPPLGTKEAVDIQANRGYHVDINDKTEPTGKTGVAYGLLVKRIDIKEITDSKEGEVGFQFYVGREIDGIFKLILEKGCKFGEWKYLCKTRKDEEYYQFLYTKSPKVALGDMLAIDANEKEIYLENPKDGEKIYICAISQNKFEYRIVKHEEELYSNKEKYNFILLES